MPRSGFPRSNSDFDRQALLQHPDASMTLPGATLPHPMEDPNPALTHALHNLWAAIRPYLVLTEEGGSFQTIPANPNWRIGEALVSFRTFVISAYPFYERAFPLITHFTSGRIPTSVFSRILVQSRRWDTEFVSGSLPCRASVLVHLINAFYSIWGTSFLKLLFHNFKR